MGGQILRIVDVILPVFLVAAVGALFGRFVVDRIAAAYLSRRVGATRVDVESVSVLSATIRRSLHVFTFSVAGPALVFTKLHRTELSP